MTHSGPMKHRGAPCARHLRIVALLLAFGLLTACKTSQEAINAATQLSTVSQQLTAYYTDLSNQVADTITLQEMYAEQNSRAMNEDLKTSLNTTQEELAKRVALAQALGKLANAYAALANSKAATDISTAAEGLANECKSIAPLPGGSAIPDVVSAASKQLVEYVRQRKLRKSSDAISQIVSGVQAMFASEMKAYETQNKERLRIAASVSRQFVKAGRGGGYPGAGSSSETVQSDGETPAQPDAGRLAGPRGTRDFQDRGNAECRFRCHHPILVAGIKSSQRAGKARSWEEALRTRQEPFDHG